MSWAEPAELRQVGHSRSSGPAPLGVLGSAPAVCKTLTGASLRPPGGTGPAGTSTVGSGCRPAASPTAGWPLGGIWRPGRPAVPGGRPGRRRPDGPPTSARRPVVKELLTSGRPPVAAAAGPSTWMPSPRPSPASGRGSGWALGGFGDIRTEPEGQRVRLGTGSAAAGARWSQTSVRQPLLSRHGRLLPGRRRLQGSLEDGRSKVTAPTSALGVTRAPPHRFSGLHHRQRLHQTSDGDQPVEPEDLAPGHVQAASGHHACGQSGRAHAGGQLRGGRGGGGGSPRPRCGSGDMNSLRKRM